MVTLVAGAYIDRANAKKTLSAVASIKWFLIK